MLLAALLAQATVTPPAPPAVQPASSRTLTGRFACDDVIYEVQVTATPPTGAGVMLDRLTIAGKPVDAGSLAEARRMAVRLADVQSVDLRCRSDGAGELSIYGTQGAPPRRARLRGVLQGAGVSALTIAVAR